MPAPAASAATPCSLPDLGAWVAATAGAKNAGFVQSLGADQVIDYTKGDFASQVKDIDLVFDLIGGDVRFDFSPC